MRVLIPGALLSYTGSTWVEAEGATVAEALADLDRQFPGIRFRMIDEQGRIRRNMRFFHDRAMIFDLDTRIPPEGELMIVQALSGG
ncbi:MAG: MoaD/ThiS family protein [Burkholderiaceae bacterium]|nr:MoaD/ThiS family protein [Burkholderiaceae bacterium]